MTAAYDAIVIGGGHNGLTAAAYLGKAGLRTLVVEAAEQYGGAAVTREFAPGFRVSAVAHLLHGLHPRVVADLQLERHGLAYAAREIATAALLPGGRRLEIGADAPRTRASLNQFSAHDADAYPKVMARLIRQAAALGVMLARTPPRPDLMANDWHGKIGLGILALHMRRLGRKDMLELTRILAMNSADLVNDYFESDALKGLLTFESVFGLFLGPRSPSTVYNLLYRLAGFGRHGLGGLHLPAGGMGTVTAALAAACRARNVELRANAPVARVLMRADRAQGVVLANGEEIGAKIVFSGTDPAHSLLTLVGHEHLDTNFAQRMRHLRMNGCSAKIHLALDGLPESWRQGPARMIVAPSADYVERAYDDAKYGRVSAAPALEIVIPTLHDSSLAPAGQHVASIMAQFSPYKLKEASPDEARRQILDRAIAAMSAQAPDLTQRIKTAEVLTPHDLESQFRLTGGQWHHGEITLDQVFLLRPAGGYQQYRSPIPGLWFCGAGAHPGGHVTGLPGANAAREALRHRGEWSRA
ncbi:MAG TPA: NAD(P)/FAD-dependent oxidoreductase [Dongiaceae bacterium]|jgi:phytoene dehydrogenase-like protein